MDLTAEQRDTMAVVLKTLRWAAGRTAFFDSDAWVDLVSDLEFAVDKPGRLDWGCPVCQKIYCYEGCPMESVRRGSPVVGDA